MGMSAGSGGGAMGEINVTPLVDVMLVLLIIFMVTAPMMNAGVDIDLPKVDAPPTSVEPNQLLITIDRELNYTFGQGKDSSKFTKAEMIEKLPELAKIHAGKPVFLSADTTVPYGEVALVLAIAKKSGIPRVGLVFEPGVSEEGE